MSGTSERVRGNASGNTEPVSELEDAYGMYEILTRARYKRAERSRWEPHQRSVRNGRSDEVLDRIPRLRPDCGTRLSNAAVVARTIPQGMKNIVILEMPHDIRYEGGDPEEQAHLHVKPGMRLVSGYRAAYLRGTHGLKASVTRVRNRMILGRRMDSHQLLRTSELTVPHTVRTYRHAVHEIRGFRLS